MNSEFFAVVGELFCSSVDLRHTILLQTISRCWLKHFLDFFLQIDENPRVSEWASASSRINFLFHFSQRENHQKNIIIFSNVCGSVFPPNIATFEVCLPYESFCNLRLVSCEMRQGQIYTFQKSYFGNQTFYKENKLAGSIQHLHPGKSFNLFI